MSLDGLATEEARMQVMEKADIRLSELPAQPDVALAVEHGAKVDQPPFEIPDDDSQGLELTSFIRGGLRQEFGAGQIGEQLRIVQLALVWQEPWAGAGAAGFRQPARDGSGKSYQLGGPAERRSDAGDQLVGLIQGEAARHGTLVTRLSRVARGRASPQACTP